MCLIRTLATTATNRKTNHMERVEIRNMSGKTLPLRGQPLAPEGNPRVRIEREQLGVASVYVGGYDVEVPVYDNTEIWVEGIPEPQEGVYLVVNPRVKSALPDRRDLLVPAQIERDLDGRRVDIGALTR